MILLIDNYDSFVHNLARYLRRLGQETEVVRNDAVSVSDIESGQPDAIVFSPGPCAPEQAGCCLEVIRELHQSIPMLGVCLGHQAIAEAFGGKIVRANEPVHGRASLVTNDGSGCFAGLPGSFRVGRYHSLVACPETLPACLHANAILTDRTVMAFHHREFPVVGWQFHPESVLTEYGYSLLRSFLQMAGIGNSSELNSLTELQHAAPAQPDWFTRAIEFPRK